VFAQHVRRTDSSVHLVNAYIRLTDVMVTVTAGTAAMNATAVSFNVTFALLCRCCARPRTSSLRNWARPLPKHFKDQNEGLLLVHFKRVSNDEKQTEQQAKSRRHGLLPIPTFLLWLNPRRVEQF